MERSFIITGADVANAGSFFNTVDCAMKQVIDRQFPELKINTVGIYSVHATDKTYKILPAFTLRQCRLLQAGGKPFKATITEIVK